MPLPRQGAADKAYSVRSHLVAYGLAVAIPLVALMGVALVRAAMLEREQLEARMLQVASALSDEIDRDFDRRVTLLETLATSPALAADDYAGFHAQTSAAVREAGIGIFLIDAASLQQLTNTYTPYGTPLPTYGNSTNAALIIESRKPQVSGLFIGRVSKRPAIDVGIPVVRDGSVRYLLVLGLTPENLLPILQGQKFAPEWVSTISDRSDVVLARSRGHEHYSGTSLPQALSRSIYQTGVFKTTNLDGERVLLAATSTQLTGWRIAVTVPVSLIESSLRSSLWLWGGVSSAAIILAGMLGLALARRLERPLIFTADAARTLGRGELVSGFASGVREANVVVEAMGNASRELAARDKRQRLLLSELSHRVKNILAVVQALVSRTLADGTPNARAVVNQRLQALARAHDLLMKTDWQGASLREIVMAEVSAHSGQVHVGGPDVVVGTKTVQTLALVLHELCTNATKYGALSSAQGSVSVTWAIEGVADMARFRFRWEERGGPPIVAPAKKGFGSTLLETAIGDDLGTSPRIIFAPEGFRYELDVPLAAIVQEDDILTAPPPT